MHNDEAKQKAINTCIAKYGVDNPAKVDIVKSKSKETCMLLYGVESIAKLDSVKNKRKSTCMAKYGVDTTLKCDHVKKKSEETYLRKYGCKHSSQNEDVRNKMFATNMNRYGCKSSLQNKNVLNKSKDTCLKHFGVAYPGMSDVVKDKIKETNLARYGCTCVLTNKSIKEKVCKTNLEKYGYENASKNVDVRKKISDSLLSKRIQINDSQFVENFKRCNNVDSLFEIYSNDDLFTKFIKLVRDEKLDLLRLNDIADIFSICPNTVRAKIDKLNLSDLFYIKESAFETKFKDFLDANHIRYDRRNRSTISDSNGKPLELDFLLLDYNIAIEINDIRSHNIKRKDANYHFYKVLKCSEVGIRLIHIWEWELTDDTLWNRISKWILNLLNDKKVKVPARKCLIKQVPLIEEREFLNEFHLQSYKKSDLCYGLYYNNTLIELMSFCKPRYSTKHQYELLRLCTKYGYSVIGGSNRLFKNFIKQYNPTSIISYCDLSKFTGDVYEHIGFAPSKRKISQIIWFNKENGKHFLQSSLMKIGADRLTGNDCGKGSSNEEVAIKAGYKSIYSCGLAVFEFINNGLVDSYGI